jgi:hypothetical protein
LKENTTQPRNLFLGFDGIGTAEALKGERKKVKVKRDYNTASEFSPGCERFGDEKSCKGKRKKWKVERDYNVASEFSPGDF